MIIQIIGLPGSGKTTLAKELADRLDAVHFNADEVRSDLNSDLGFTSEDRIEQSRRMGALARLTSGQGFITIVDFICPTKETRNAFGFAHWVIWVDRIKEGRFEDTNSLWEDPENYDVKIDNGMTVEEEADYIINELGENIDYRKPTALMVGRFQPWHEGHEALYQEALKRTGQVLIGIRNTYRTSEKDPMMVKEVRNTIPKGRMVKILPNITHIVYGRDVGYKIEQVSLSQDIESISATQKRKELGI